MPCIQPRIRGADGVSILMGSKLKKERRRDEVTCEVTAFVEELFASARRDGLSFESGSVGTIVYTDNGILPRKARDWMQAERDIQTKRDKLVRHARDLLERGCSPESVRRTVELAQEAWDFRVRVGMNAEDLVRLLVTDFPRETAVDEDWSGCPGHQPYFVLRVWCE